MAKPIKTGARRAAVSYRQLIQAGLRQHKREAGRSIAHLLAQPGSTLLICLAMAGALTLPVLLYLTLQHLQQLTAYFTDSAQITLYLHDTVTEQQAQALADELNLRPEIEQTQLISKAQAADQFAQFTGLGAVLDSLEGNPLPASIVIQPYEHTPVDIEALSLWLQQMPQVQQIQVDQAWIERMHRILTLGRQLVMALFGLLAGVILLVVMTTVRLSVAARHSEIQVAALIGATHRFIRRPFLYMGLWIGLIGAVLTLAIVQPLWLWLSALLGSVLVQYDTLQASGLGIGNSLALVALSVLLCMAGAYAAVSRHLHSLQG